MTKIEYLLAGVLAGSSAKMLMEAMDQAKMDRCRKVSKDTKVPLDQVVAIADMDPTATGSYIDWLVKVAAKGELPSKEEIGQTLSRFDRLKKLPDFSANKNVLSYPTWADLNSVVGAAHAVSSRTEKDRQIRKFSAYILKKYPNVDSDGNPLPIGGYPDWIDRLVKSGDAVLPEDANLLLELIDAFEVKRKDKNFRKSKNILSYETRAQLNQALVDDEDPSKSINSENEAIPDGPGLKKLDSSFANGHYYDLYMVTTPEVAAVQFDKSLFQGKNGWCVKDPNIFTNMYHLGPKNPAYFFRKDGVPYVLSDLKSGDVKDQNDAMVSPSIIMELLYLRMPDALKQNILDKHPWTKGHSAAIMAGGIDAAVVASFQEAFKATQGNLSPQERWQVCYHGGSKKQNCGAFFFLKYFGYEYPPAEAMEYIIKTPIMAMCYAVFVEKARIPKLEPLILTCPRASTAYYDYFNAGTTVTDEFNADPKKKKDVLFKVPGGGFKNHKWPEYYDTIQGCLEKCQQLPLYKYAMTSGIVIPDKEFTYTIPGKEPRTSTWLEVFTKGAPWSGATNTTQMAEKYKLAVETDGDYINEPL